MFKWFRLCLSTLMVLTSAAILLSGCLCRPAAGKKLNLAIWSEYVTSEVLEKFEKETGIHVNVSNYSSNEELLAKMQAGAEGYDLIVPSDYMVTVMISLGLLQAIDKTKITHLANIDEQWLNRAFDRTNQYSLPYTWSITGIAVNQKVVKTALSGWSDFFAQAAQPSGIAVFDDGREALGAALKMQGASLNTTDTAELTKAKEVLVKARPGIKAFTSTPAQIMEAGEVGAAQMYSNEALRSARKTGGTITFVIPQEGSSFSLDNVTIPAAAKNVAEAHALINYFYQLENQVDLVTRMLAGPILKGTKEALPKELQSHPVIFPAADVLTKGEMMRDLESATLVYDRLWTEIKASP